ncbi:hypothetical protein TcG_09696 [Trypanosoma cruzi]|nr:hypothetical protein TcG_09696 [Trypanosoma cruzi]
MSAADNDRKKPAALLESLFMWEMVASFSTPLTVCELERICRDVHAVLTFSSTGTRLMQRYWYAQYNKLIWEENRMDPSRRTLDFTLTRSEGKRNWKKMYCEEYPLYLARTTQGKGANNNAINMAKVRFKTEWRNEILSGVELAKLQITPQEALARRVARNLVSLEGEEVNGTLSLHHHHNNNNNNNVVVVATGTGSIGGDGGGGCDSGMPQQSQQREEGEATTTTMPPRHQTDKRGRRKGGHDGQSRAMKDPALGLSRDDYNNDRRLGKHKSKHKKGGTHRWSTFASGELDYDY